MTQAPTEAEAQCAELARSGVVYAAASEDMDTLTFGSPILLRHLTFSEQRKMPIDEVHLDKALEGLEMDMKQVNYFRKRQKSRVLITYRGWRYSLLIYVSCLDATTWRVLKALGQQERIAWSKSTSALKRQSSISLRRSEKICQMIGNIGMLESFSPSQMCDQAKNSI